MILLGVTYWDIIIFSPASFVVGAITGYILRARFHGKED